MCAQWRYVGSPSGPVGSGGVAEVLAVHAALVPMGTGGSIVYFSGSQWVEPLTWESISNETNPFLDPKYLAAKAEIDHCRVYDCAIQKITNPGCPDADLFCSGHALLADGRLVVAGGTQHFPEQGTVDLHHAHWSGSRETWIFSPSGQMRAAIKGKVTAVWAPSSTSHLDLFVVGPDGTVWSTWWDAASGWQKWFSIKGTIKAAANATITAVWAPHLPDHLDLFMTGTDGAVWSTWWEGARGWQAWFLIHPEVKMQPGVQVSALWRNQHLDLFVTGTDGAVWSTWWEANRNWQPWFFIHPGIKAAVGATVTALWAPYPPDHLDLFMTGTDGAVWSTWWDAAHGWQSWFLIHPEIKMQPGVQISALWRNLHLDLFVTGTDGAVWSTWWESSRNWQPWFLIHSNIKAAVGATVTALWAPHQPDHLDLFMTGTDGAVWSTWWESVPSWQPWFLIHPEIKMQPGVEISALWRNQHLDLFATGTDGAVWSTWWEATPSWHTWFFILNALNWEQAGLLNRDPGQTQAGAAVGGGRWYPTLVTLGNGQIMALCGHPLISAFTNILSDFDNRHNNTKPELFHPETGTWGIINQAVGVDQAHDYAPFYPRLHVVPHTGEVFIVQPLYSKQVVPYQPGLPQCAHPAAGQDLCSTNPLDTNPPYGIEVMDKSIFYDPFKRTVTRAFGGPQFQDPIYLNRFYTSQQTTSVMLPLFHEANYKAFVLLCGGAQPLIVDLTPGLPFLAGWQPTAPRQLAGSPVRNFATATLLPTGSVLLSGGVTKDPYKEADGVRTAEIYHPAMPNQAEHWEVGAVAHETRGYHSVALLMPDGRVWTAGSEWNDTGTPNLSIELFEPDYISVSNRAQITACPDRITYGQQFPVTLTGGFEITRVALMRFGSVTHSFDGDQRFVGVPFTQQGVSVIVTAPPDGTVAPPGHYMLWLIDSNRFPCRHASIVRIS